MSLITASESSKIIKRFSELGFDVMVKDMGNLVSVSVKSGGRIERNVVVESLKGLGFFVLGFSINGNFEIKRGEAPKGPNLRNLILTNFISEDDALSVIAKAVENNPDLNESKVGKYDVVFTEVNSLKFTVVVVNDHANGVGIVASAGFYREESGDPSKVTVICASCYGRGKVSTGITECPTTICEPCNGTGKV